MTLTNFPADSLLDLDPWVGQRQCTFRFDVTDGLTGQNMGTITPIRNASITHDTTRTIKRQLTIDLGIVDTAAINTITDRISVFMVFPSGVEYPLGKFMFTDDSRQVFTRGSLGSMVLNDEMFLVDQQIEEGIAGTGVSITALIQQILADLPITLDIVGSPYLSVENWGIGTGRGQVLESLSVSGDYFSPWFGNDGAMHFIRTFDPASVIPDFDWDTGKKVFRESILETNDLLTAPNRFIVISNAADDPDNEVVGTYDVPSTAPHSISNRGFVIADVQDIQLANAGQATAVAAGIGQRLTVFERVGLNTPPDPRHDSYNVIRWQGENWLELAWGMALVEGGAMSHFLRKAYTP
jgi:hypothetical protein